MAALLITQAFALLVGLALGFWICAFRMHHPKLPPLAPPPRRWASEEWERHCEAHARAIEGSTVMTAPGLME